ISSNQHNLPALHTRIQVFLSIGAGINHSVEDVLGSLAHSKNGSCTLGILDVVGFCVIVHKAEVSTIADCLVCVHVAIDTKVVSQDHTHKAPLVAQDNVTQFVVAASPLGSNVVERGHNS